MFGLKWRPSWFFLSKWRPARGRSSWRPAKIETVGHRGHMSQIWCFWKNLNQKSLSSLTIWKTLTNEIQICHPCLVYSELPFKSVTPVWYTQNFHSNLSPLSGILRTSIQICHPCLVYSELPFKSVTPVWYTQNFHSNLSPCLVYSELPFKSVTPVWYTQNFHSNLSPCLVYSELPFKSVTPVWYTQNFYSLPYYEEWKGNYFSIRL